MPRRYLLDANAFIEANRRYYSFDICPAYWDALLDHNGKGAVLSIDRVLDELSDGKDALKEWAEDAPEGFFMSSGAAGIVTCFGRLQVWANTRRNPPFLRQALSEFATKADAWLVAYALHHDLVVVTHEAFSAQKVNRVLIPVACQEFAVKYVDVFTMLRELQARFVLETA